MVRCIRICLASAALLLAAATVFCCATQASADDYPNRKVSLIVPFPPGGGVDTVGRVIAQKLTTYSASR